MKRKTRNIVGTLIILVVFGFLLSTSIRNSYKYYYTVEEAISKSKELSGKEIKIAGIVKKGSVSLKKGESALSFILAGTNKELKVDYKGQIPDTFKEETPVVIEGKFSSDTEFNARVLLTKCASKYEEKLK